MTARRRGRFGRRIGVVAVVVLAQCVLASVAWGSFPPPTVSITSPSSGATVEGTVSVAMSAKAGTGDTISTITLYDGPNSIGTARCPSQPTCTTTLSWYAAGLTGSHSLLARVASGAGFAASSTAVVVTVVSPPPTVTITAPAANATASGLVQVATSGQTDPSQDDYPTRITLFDGPNEVGSTTCGILQTCAGTVDWNATGLSGTHVLTARIATYRGFFATSDAVSLTIVSPPPTVRIASPQAGAALSGTVSIAVTGATDPSQVDYPTEIDVYDGTNQIGSVTCQGQAQTCAGTVAWNTAGLKGSHTLHATISTYHGLSASSATLQLGAATRAGATSAKRSISMKCQLASFRVAVKTKDHGSCAVVGAPAGTPASVRFKRKGGWTTVLKGHVLANGRFSFTLRGTIPASFDLWASVSASKKSFAASKHLGVLKIGRG